MSGFHESQRPVDFAVPPLDAIISYRGIYVLCTVTRDNKQLKATHYAAMLSGGAFPIWGVWTIHGRFIRFFGRKSTIAEAYPRLVWRRKQATWSMLDVHDKDEQERAAELHRLYRRDVVITGREIDLVLEERRKQETADRAENVVPLRA